MTRGRIAFNVGLVAVLLIVWLAHGTHAATTSCAHPMRVHTVRYGDVGETIVSQAERVPPGAIWRIDAAGIGNAPGFDPGVALEYKLQIDHPFARTPAADSFVPLQVGPLMRATPELALTRPIVLVEGERLSARVSTATATGKVHLVTLGWQWPAACLSAVLGLTAVVE